MSGADAVKEDRLWQRHADMAKLGGTPKGGVNRQALSAEDAAARATLAGWAGARLGLSARPDLAEVVRGFLSLNDAEARAAFVHTLRAVIDPGGQRVSGHDRLYLAAAVPSMLVWGEIDPIIPAEHGRRAHELMPGSRLELFEHAGHFPHLDDPLHFTQLLRAFTDSTEPADVQPERARELMLARAA